MIKLKLMPHILRRATRIRTLSPYMRSGGDDGHRSKDLKTSPWGIDRHIVGLDKCTINK